MNIPRWFKKRTHDLNEELRDHLDLEAEEQYQAGLPPSEARYAARRAFGNPTLIAEDTRSSTLASFEPLARDLKYAARSLRKSPVFATIAILTLALGIGANTAIFSVVNALMLRPLPFHSADQIVRIYATKNGSPIRSFSFGGGPSPLDMRDYEQNSRSFQKMASYDVWRKNVSFQASSAEPQQMFVGLMPSAYFETLEIQPLMGRLFTDLEQIEGNHYEAVISTRLWRDRFGNDPAILSRKILINDEPYSIIGVIPDVIPEWVETRDVQVWTPFARADVWSEDRRGGRGDGALARLKPGVSMEAAQADLASIAARLAM